MNILYGNKKVAQRTNRIRSMSNFFERSESEQCSNNERCWTYDLLVHYHCLLE